MSNVRQSGFCLAMAAILACCVMVAILPRASVGADLPPPWKVHNKPADYAIFRYDGAVANKLLDLDPYGNAVKPEALLPLDEKDGKLRALLFFDGPEEGEPRPVEFKLP